MTCDDYVAMPDDGKRYELHEGRLSQIPSTTLAHQEVLGNLLVTVVQPDIIYLDEERARLLSERALEGAPTLAIEIVIPSTDDVDRHTKRTLYARHDVPWHWIVDPATRTIEVYRLEADAYVQIATLRGAEPIALPPFWDLPLDPAVVWR